MSSGRRWFNAKAIFSAGDPGIRIKDRHISIGVHTGVRPAGADYRDRLPQQLTQSLIQYAFDRNAI